jgi:hypothetical protein
MESEAERKRERSNPFPPARSLEAVYGGSSTAGNTRASDGVSDNLGRPTGEMGSGSGSGSKGSELEIGVNGNGSGSGNGVLTWSAIESVDVDMEETDNAALKSREASKSIPATTTETAPTTISKPTNLPPIPPQRSASLSSRSTTPTTNPQSQTYNRKPQTPEEMALAKEKRRAAMLAAMNGSSSSAPAGLGASSSVASVSMSSLPVGAGWSVPDEPAGAGTGSGSNAGGGVSATASTSTSTSGVGAKRGLERGGTPSVAGSASGSGLMPWEPSSLT